MRTLGCYQAVELRGWTQEASSPPSFFHLPSLSLLSPVLMGEQFHNMFPRIANCHNGNIKFAHQQIPAFVTHHFYSQVIGFRYKSHVFLIFFDVSIVCIT